MKEDYIINITTVADFLRINPNEISEIYENDSGSEYAIYVKLKRRMHECPYCESEHIEIKEWKTRKVKHALLFSKMTNFYIKYPRFICKSCSKTFNQPNLLAPKRGRNSYETIRLILENLLNYNATFESTAHLFHTTNTNVVDVFDTYVNPKRKSLPRVLSIDEFYNKGQFCAPYSVVLFDFLNTKIIDVTLDRKKTSLNKYFCLMQKTEKSHVEYVVIDMWQPYLEIARIHFPKAVVAIDSFHVMQHLGNAVNDCVYRIRKRYRKGTKEYYFLKKYMYLMKKEPKIWEEKVKIKYTQKYMNEYDILNEIMSYSDDLKRMHNYYVRYKFFNEHASFESAKYSFEKMIFPEDGVIVEEMIPVINMFQNWSEWIINSFLIVDGKRLSNGPMEGTNSQIKKLMHVGNGFGNFTRFRNRIIHCYNKEIALHPVEYKINKIKRKPRGKYKKSAKYDGSLC